MILKDKVRNRTSMFLKTSGLTLPQSLLIIPDGNGRWAKSLGLSVSEGHLQGGKTMSSILDDFMKVNIRTLGIWGFSEDNWKRPAEEIVKIMEVIENSIKDNLTKLMENNIRFLALGKRERIKVEFPTLFTAIEDAENKTANNTEKTLALFVDYGERLQLEEFAKKRAADKTSDTYKLLSDINQGLPLFDLVLRTSGEQRLSGFGPLVSLAEFVSIKKNLPELNDDDIVSALQEFSSRQRRFGGRS